MPSRGRSQKAEPMEAAGVWIAELAPQRPEGRPVDKGVASRIFVLLRRSGFGGSGDVMHNAFLALTAAGLAGLSGYGINAQATPMQTA